MTRRDMVKPEMVKAARVRRERMISAMVSADTRLVRLVVVNAERIAEVVGRITGAGNTEVEIVIILPIKVGVSIGRWWSRRKVSRYASC